jgi:hypothetical protein
MTSPVQTQAPVTKPGTPAAKPGTPAATTAPVPVAPAKAELTTDFISESAFMLAPELASQTMPTRARSEKQHQMDVQVARLHAVWVKASKPSTWDAMVKGGAVATYFVQPELAADLHKLISRAITFHGLRARMGTAFKVTDKHVVQYHLPAEYLGREAVSFAVLDKRPRATSGGKPAAVITK